MKTFRVSFTIESEDTKSAVKYVQNNYPSVRSFGVFETNNAPLPAVATQAKNVASSIGKAIVNPTPVSKEERERRLAICHQCEFLIDGKRCAKCGCHVNWKTRLEAWHCPIQKW